MWHSWVVCYSTYLLLNCHNIETCVSMKGIMYLHRYMMKTQ
jgi:hypothetical protein